MPDFIGWLRKEWGVIISAPWTFVTGGVLIAGAVWLAATAYFQEELSSARQETKVAEANARLWKDKATTATASASTPAVPQALPVPDHSAKANAADPQQPRPRGRSKLHTDTPASAPSPDPAQHFTPVIIHVPVAVAVPSGPLPPCISTPGENSQAVGNYISGTRHCSGVVAPGKDSKADYNVQTDGREVNEANIPADIRGRSLPERPRAPSPPAAAPH